MAPEGTIFPHFCDVALRRLRRYSLLDLPTFSLSSFWEVVSFADSFCEVVPFADSFSFGGPLVRPFLCLSCSSLGRGPPNNCIVVRSLVSAEYGCNRRPSMGPSPLRPRWVSWTPLLIGLKGGWGLVGLLRGY